MKACYTDRYEVPLIPSHPFPMQKYRLVREKLLAESTLSYWHLEEPSPAFDDDILLAHSADYWLRCCRNELSASEVRRIGFPWSPALIQRSRASVQGTIDAARNASKDGIASNLSGGTHHAFADHGEGYCVLNDIAIAARVLQRDGLASRIAVVDCDVHQGNGTAAIFAADPTVFTFSIHAEKNFPLRKEASDLDVNLPNGAGDDDYLRALQDHLPLILSEFRPDFVFYQAGVDPLRGDRLGKLNMTHEGLAARDRYVLESCRKRSVPVVTTMGGGYGTNILDTVEAHCNTIRVAISLS